MRNLLLSLLLVCVTVYVTVAQNADCDGSVLCEGPRLTLVFEEPIGEIECDQYLTPEEAAPEPIITWQGGEQVTFFL